MRVCERDIARPVRPVLFPDADKCYTLCNVTNSGRLNFDRLGADKVNISVCDSRATT